MTLTMALLGVITAQSSDAVKMGFPVMTVPNAPRVTKLFRGGTSSDLQSGTVLQFGDKIENISGADVDVVIQGLGMIRVKPHSEITFAATPKPKAKFIVTLNRGRMMCWVKFNPTQYAFQATCGPVNAMVTTGPATSFMMQTSRQPLKQPNYVTLLVGNGSVVASMDTPDSAAFVLDGQILKIDPRNAVGQPWPPDDFEKRDLRDLRNWPY